MFRLTSRIAAIAIVCTSLNPFAAYAADTEETQASASSPTFASAMALVDAHQYAEALPSLLALNEQTPKNPDVLNLIGFSLRKMGKMDEALDYYTRALAINPEHHGANEYLGELYLEIGQPEKAKERLEVLRLACKDCEEFEELQDKIIQYSAN